MTDSLSAYTLAHAATQAHPEAFWAEAAMTLHWDTPWERVLDERAAPLYRWFSGGQMNTCGNAIDRHVLNRHVLTGRGAQAAVIYESSVTGAKRTISWGRWPT